MEAEDQYQLGVDLKKKGQIDAALTAFRRAVIADPNHFLSHLEIGGLFREKAKTDPMFFRHAFEAFQKAARLNPIHEQAHTYYIMLGQKTGHLDSLLEEYKALVKKFPDNALLEQCLKNIMTLTLASIPINVNLQEGHSGSLKKFVLIFSVLVLAMGLLLMVVPPLLLKKGKIKKEQVSGLLRAGLLMEAAAVGGFIFKSKLN
ncbi:MAG: hypothetical protein KCHDKBKB_02284 [Elusimicrobia bacterium]|nr:hypothetical protein [Elusimicrobiota bacterium]